MSNSSKHKKTSVNKNKSLQKFIEFKEYFLIKENKEYKIDVSKKEEEIIIKIQNYEIKANNNDLSILLKTKLNNINEAYFFIINKFKEKKVLIREIKEKKEVKLLFKIVSNNKEEQREIILIYNNEKINNKNKNDTQIYNENNKIISEKINCPKDICFSNAILTQSYSFWDIDNTFAVFKSINDILYLVYSNNQNYLNCLMAYDLIDNKKIIEIKYYKYSIDDYITNIRYFFDNIYKRDLIMSVNGTRQNIKIWNINNFELILDIKNIYPGHNGISSGCFLTDYKQNYFLTSCSFNNKQSIKIFDFNGNEISEIKDSKEQTFFIDVYYDIKFNKIYILTGNNGNIKVYDYNNNKVKNRYCDNSNSCHKSIKIHDNDSIIKIIESCEDGIIRIWDFNSGELLNRIKINNKELNGICLWNNNYLFVGCADNTIKLVEFNKNIIINSLEGHNSKVLTFKKIIHPQYGECLLSQGYKNDKIIIWRKC